MTNVVNKDVEMLEHLGISAEVVSQADEIFQAIPQVKQSFENPATALTAKHNVIDKVFPEPIRDFIKLLCDNEEIVHWDEIVSSYTHKDLRHSKEEKVLLTYVSAPSKEQLDGFMAFLEKEYHYTDEVITMVEDPTLGSGFVLQVGSDVYDWSAKGRTLQLQDKLRNLKSNTDTSSNQNIISILKSEIEDFSLEAQNKEVGFVTLVGDGIVNINGIDHAAYGEIILFDSGVKGMVQDIRIDEIGCILFGSDREIREGDRAVRTGKMAGIPVGEGFLGRVIDALGAPIDGGDSITQEDYMAVEEAAPSIVDRKSVSEPMETGILAIDSMFPIGRGQRELIIGDRQTGKTSIATDTIINQKGKDMICIYVAIGQKASTVAQLHNTLKQKEAMD
jgi:F-type H+-transporting ATPase subunit alpha